MQIRLKNGSYDSDEKRFIEQKNKAKTFAIYKWQVSLQLLGGGLTPKYMTHTIKLENDELES